MAELRFPVLGGLYLGGVPFFNSATLDASGKKLAWIVQAREAATLTHLGFRYGTRTGTPPTYRISLQGVSATTGEPDGTVLGGGSPASATFTPPADTTWNGTWQWVALSNSYTTTRGQLFAVVIDYSSGTVNGTNNSSFSYSLNGLPVHFQRGAFPYYATHDGASWSKSVDGLVYGYKSASQVYGWPLKSTTDKLVTTSGHRSALHFLLPAGAGDTFRVAGLRAWGYIASGSFKVALWPTSGAALQELTVDGDQTVLGGIGQRMQEWWFQESSLATLSCGTSYYLGYECVGNSTTGPQDCFVVDAANDIKAFPGNGDWFYAGFDGSSWAEDRTVRPIVEPILADMSQSSGASLGWAGGIRPRPFAPGMAR